MPSLSVVQQRLSSDEMARKFSVSKRWVNKLLVEFRSGGLAAISLLSKRPLTTPNKNPTIT
ncbi:leucine-zipper of insertion element IS481 [Candidatus Aquiluna sp. UB-MaderosW2red]|nr:leucine-zipper of insertion element IS481 [Candidatus Aquiluna sp. UB-MaderosW2red]